MIIYVTSIDVFFCFVSEDQDKSLQLPLSSPQRGPGALTQGGTHLNAVKSSERNLDESEQSLSDLNSRKLIVTDIPSDVTDTVLELYFESHKRSGGGDIESIDRVSASSAIITFEESSGE